MSNKNFVVFFSGTGTNLKSLIDNIHSTNNGTLLLTITDNPKAKGINIAENANIPVHVINRSLLKSKDEFESQIIDVMESCQQDIDLICLAGFMRILSPNFVQRYKNKIINIHPSLLPKYKGLNTHQRVIENKDKEHGSTVHYVDESLDGGEIIAQAKCEVEENDTIETLTGKVKHLEHKLYPEVVKKIFG